MGPQQAARLRRKLDLGGGTVDPHVAAKILERNCYLRDFFLELLPAEGVVIDIGARVGCFSVLALELLEPELLVAFEPRRDEFDLLVKNIAAVEPTARVETVLAALSSSAGRLPEAALDRQLVRLGVDDLPIRVLRLSAEGVENEILEGGAECLQRTAGVVGELQHEGTAVGRFRELLRAFVVAIGAPTPHGGPRPFWALRKSLLPVEQRRQFLDRAEMAGLRESLWQLTEDRREAQRELESGNAAFLGSFDRIDRQLALNRDVIEWQKGSLVRLRSEHDAGVHRSLEMNSELHRALGGLDERLEALGRQLESVEGSVQQAAELARGLAREADKALRESASGLEERLDVLGRRLNTLQESALREPDLVQPLLSSKPWRAYLQLGRAKRAMSRKLAPLTGWLRPARSRQRQADREAAQRLRRRSRRTGRHRALWIDRRPPTPDRDAASQRADNLASVLRETGFEVSFLPLEPQVAEGNSSLAAHLEEEGSRYDLVIVSRAPVAADCMRQVRALCPRAKVVFDTVDLHYLRESRLAELEDSDPLREAAAERRRQELGAARLADLTLVVSQAEKQLLGREAPELAVHVLSSIHQPCPSAAGFPARRDLLFLADFRQPHNVDAAIQLVDRYLPAIRSRLPEVRLHLVGGDPTAELLARASDEVMVTGFVPDLEPYLDQCRLLVAPLRYCAGVMAKITRAMACGLPCVTTTIGAEGIGLVHEEDAMIADGEREFADCVARAYGDEALWLRLSQAGMTRVRDEFSFAAAHRSVAAMLEAVGHRRALERKFHTVEFGLPD